MIVHEATGFNLLDNPAGLRAIKIEADLGNRKRGEKGFERLFPIKETGWLPDGCQHLEDLSPLLAEEPRGLDRSRLTWQKMTATLERVKGLAERQSAEGKKKGLLQRPASYPAVPPHQRFVRGFFVRPRRNF